MLDGTFGGILNLAWGLVDVRDVAKYAPFIITFFLSILTHELELTFWLLKTKTHKEDIFVVMKQKK